MSKKINKPKKSAKSVFTDLDNDMKRENQVYVNEEILEAVIDAKRKSANKGIDNTDQKDRAVPSTVRKDQRTKVDATPAEPKIPIMKNLEIPETENVADNEPHPDDVDIYDSLFSETTVVSTQIYTHAIDKNLGEDNYSSEYSYRVGQDTSDIGSIFTITKMQLSQPLNISRSHSHSDIAWYNDLAGLGFSYAAVCGTRVQGVIICEPQYWNNTLYIRHLMVEKTHRLNGIGKKLIDECVHRAQAESFRALALEVTSKNGAAIEFYRHMHFNIVGMNVGLYSNTDILKEDVGIFMNRVIIY